MAGYIVHRPDRPRPYLARFAPKGGRIVSKSFTSKRRAEQWLKTQDVDKYRGEWMDPRAGQTLFSIQAATWMASRRSNRPTTTARDASVMRSLVLYHLSDKPLNAITPETIEQWVHDLSHTHSPSTVRKAYQLASGVLRSAVRARRIPRNPAEGVSLPPLGKVERRFLSAADIETLADSIDARYRLMVLLGAYAGLRLGELAALRWSSFTVGYRAVKVTETLTDVHGKVSIGPPKTKASVRTVTLPRFLVDELVQCLQEKRRSEGISGRTDLHSGDDLLFPAPLGGPLRFAAFCQRVWRPAVEKAGLEWCTPHSLRHSMAALLIEAGEDPYVISKRLGHSSIRFTYDTYGHLLPSADEGAAEKLDAIPRTSRAPSNVAAFPREQKTQ